MWTNRTAPLAQPRQELVARFKELIASVRSPAKGLWTSLVMVEVVTEAVDRAWWHCAAAAGRPVDALLANAGHGLGRSFLDQEFAYVRHGIDTNVTGTVYLVQLVGRAMRSRHQGRVL
ncbi:MAG: SDR family NAD(P)-dependent oxidoreductase [Vicinamibacteraceae bacterium]